MSNLKYSKRVILAEGWQKLGVARNHLDGLSLFGVTAEKLHAFEAKLTEAQSIPTDLNNRIELRSRTSAKDDLLDSCVEYGRALQIRLGLAFGRSSTEYDAYPSQEFSDARNSERLMLEVMQTIVHLAEKHADALAEYGQTTAIIAEGHQLMQDLRAADLSQEAQKDKRSSQTERRDEIFAEIYDQINDINRIGRAVYDIDPVKKAYFKSPWPKAGRQDTEKAAPEA
jgi:aryl-alcohol dehydrogenase-like predicted oxidoreductase